MFLRASDYPAIFRWEEVFNIRFIFDFVFIDGAVEFLIKPFQNTVISKQIMERFYSALDAIIAMKKIRGVNTYCRLNNIDRRNFIAQRKDLERGWFQLSWLYPMVKEYGVSAKWLLTGFGRMFEEQK